MIKFFVTAFIVFFLSCSVAFAEVPVVKIGDIEVFSLLDARSEAPVSLLIGASDEQISKYVPGGKLKNQILAFLVKFSNKKILFDTGLGISKGGKMMTALKDLEVSASDIDAVLITHMHGDHIGGLLDADGKAAFSRAEVYVSRIEKDWWLNEKKDDHAKKSLEPYESEGRLHVFEFGDTLLDCITALDTSGHTPGHTAFHIKREEGEFLMVGDVLHFAEIMLHLPQIAVKYDVDPKKAPKARKYILDMAAEKNIPVAGAHFPVPGFWKVNVNDKDSSYEITPLQ